MKMTRKALIRRGIVFAIGMLIVGCGMLLPIWAAGYLAAAVEPIMEEVLWATYHAIMG